MKATNISSSKARFINKAPSHPTSGMEETILVIVGFLYESASIVGNPNPTYNYRYTKNLHLLLLRFSFFTFLYNSK